MKIVQLVMALLALTLLSAGCPRKQDEKKEKKVQKGESIGVLPADVEYASGSAQTVAMEVRTKLDVPVEAETTDEEVKKAQEASFTTQTMMVSDARGKLVFTTPDFFIPRGTELRYSPSSRRYVLADPAKKQYWAMTGSEIGNLLEGGPAMTRTGYAITITDTADKETVAGYPTTKTDTLLSFDWSVKTKAGEKKGKVKVRLAVWHTADSKLKDSWGDMMIDFLTVPFQDEGGQKVVSQLKSRLKFPLKWEMEVDNQGQTREKGDLIPKLVSVAQKVEVKVIARPELASPPAGFEPAAAPYEFGPGGQTAREDLLGKLPARKGTPPKDAPPEDR